MMETRATTMAIHCVPSAGVSSSTPCMVVIGRNRSRQAGILPAPLSSRVAGSNARASRRLLVHLSSPDESGEQFPAAGDAELAIDRLDIDMHRVRTHAQRSCGLLLGVSAEQSVECLPHARRQVHG